VAGITLVRGGLVVISAEEPVRSDAAVVVRGDGVEDVLDWRAAQVRYPDANVIGSSRFAVLPGLINAHHHGWAVSSVQLGLGESPLEPWLLAWAGLRDRNRYLDKLLSAARLLSTGVTATVDVWSGSGPAEGFATAVRDALRAYRETGIRVAFAPGIKTQSFLVWGTGEDRRFIDSLPVELKGAARSFIPDGQLSEDDYFDVMSDLGRNCAGHDRVRLWYSAPGPQWVNDAFLQRIAAQAETTDVGLQTHVNESLYEKLHGPRAYGTSTMLHLERLGVLSPRFSIAHGVWLDDDEIDAMARTGAAVSHNPGSNLRLFAGIAPLNRLREAGVTVGLGMDATTLDDEEDMFAEMRLALRLHREPTLVAPHPSPRDILAVATLGGAKLMLSERRLGRLAPGYAADLVLIDMDRVRSPWAAPECDDLDLLLLRCGRRDVDTVLVGGEVVYADGAPTRFDVLAAGEELAREMAATAFPAEAAEAVRALTPYLEGWYRAWDHPALEPRTIYNSRI
jgi:cytosine/adenosine deaminase-related metal-dependent hydrolase